MKEKKYSDFLKEVKESDPSLIHRDAQKQASELYKAYQKGPKKVKAPWPPPGPSPKTGPGKYISPESRESQGERTFPDFLKEVQEAAPSLSLRAAQKKASELYKTYKAEDLKKQGPGPETDKIKGPGPETDKISAADLSRSATIEGVIRSNIPTTLNSIKGSLNGSNITGYTIHEAGKVGVNTQVFATAPGIRVPVEGYFLVFIAR